MATNAANNTEWCGPHTHAVTKHAALVDLVPVPALIPHPLLDLDHHGVAEDLLAATVELLDRDGADGVFGIAGRE